MKIKTITCHHVYNYGATLQAYALQHFLESQGHDVEIIDFNPWFHRDRYNIWFLFPEGKKAKLMRLLPPLKWIYLPYSKWRSGMFATWGRKAAFESFEKKYYHLTNEKYLNSDQLKKNPPEADLYIAGSDQIWNTQSYNGKEPGYYLDFGKDSIKRISYAASLATSQIADGWSDFVKEKVSKLDSVSVREATGVKQLSDLGISNVTQVLDPVFLLTAEEWRRLAKNAKDYGVKKASYVLLYDFLGNDASMREFTVDYARTNKLQIVSVNDFKPRDYADININDAGPLEFISLIDNAACVIGSSFHATAFSVILEKDFYTFSLIGQDNSSRMRDFLKMLSLEKRMNVDDFECSEEIEWFQVEKNLKKTYNESKLWLNNMLF